MKMSTTSHPVGDVVHPTTTGEYFVEQENKANTPPNQKVTVDQECWIRDRLYTLVRMVLSIREQHLKGADDDIYYSSIHGAVNGCALEIIRHCNLENIYANLTEVKRILL